MNDIKPDYTMTRKEEIIHLKAAASGCVSGTLAEWPKLRIVFKNWGVNTDPDMRLEDMRDIAKAILEKIDG